MKKITGLILGLAFASMAKGQAIADYSQLISNFAVRLDSGSGVVSSGTVTGGTCTNQVMTALDTSGVPTCANISSAMIPATTILASDIQDGSALSLFGRAANTGGVMASITAVAASGCVFVETGSTLACSTVATAGLTDSAVTAAKTSFSGPGVVKFTDIAGTSRVGYDPKQGFNFFDDFLNTVTGITDPGGDTNWSISATNTPAAMTNPAQDITDHPGVVSITGNAGSTAVLLIRKAVTAFSPQTGLVGECMIYIPVITNGGVGCGFSDSTSAVNTATDGSLIWFDNVSDSHWQIRNRRAAGGAAASVSNSTVVAATWYRLTIYYETVSGGGAGTVRFYVNGVELNVSPLSADVPATTNQTGYMVGAVQSGAGAATSLVLLDYVRIYSPVSR